MKTPWYETSPGATIALLNSGYFLDVDLYTFTLAGAPFGVSSLRYSAGAVPVTAEGITWPLGPLVDREKSMSYGHWKVGLDVDDWQVSFMPRLYDPASGESFPDVVGTTPLSQAAQEGVFDGAIIQIDRAFASAWPMAGQPLKPTGIMTIFAGAVGEVDAGRSQIDFLFYTHLKKLIYDLPRNLFQSSCIHTLYDQGCTLNANNFVMNGVVTALGSTPNILFSSVAAPPGSGTFALGRIVMTSGASNGFLRTVRAWNSATGQFSLLNPFPEINVGDTFAAYAGCDKSYGTCGAFANQVNFGGCLAIPPPEVAT